MKTNTATKRAAIFLMALVLMAMGTATTIAQQGQIGARPLTHQEIADLGLPSGTQPSGGLFTVGKGQPVYLEAQLTNTIPISNVLSVTWVLTNKPLGSVAVLQASPIPLSVPIYSPGDRAVYQAVSRMLLRPDVTGQYRVRVTVTTTTGSFAVNQDITASTYMGVGNYELGITGCVLCHHPGGLATDKYTPWLETGHASFFTKAIDGLESSHYNSSCIQCHTVGYDTNALANNGGFDDIAALLMPPWTFPAVLNTNNWAAMPQELKNLSNIQCENCHGAGLDHALALGNTNVSNWPRISVSFSSGDCAQCHSELPYHSKPLEWENSKHAVATRYPTGENRAACVRCHSGVGFVDYVNGTTPPRTRYEAITCQACHDPHSAANPHQLRKVSPVTLMDGFTTVTEGGLGKLCMNCHIARRNATNYVETTVGSGNFGPHHGPQTDMLVGANAITYGKVIPSSAHREVVTNSCVTCHLQPVAVDNPAFTHAGGHTFFPSWEGDGTNGPVELVAACQTCHGPSVATFNFARQDFDGDGSVEGVQTEVLGLLERLSLLLPPVGVPKTNISFGAPAISITASWTKQQLRAGYNYLFVVEDKSFGIHNTSYAVGLLKASIADLTGDGNSDTLPDSWQIQYFGSVTNPNARPNATPAGDGVPNWLKYALGLNPLVPGVNVPDGVVWAIGNTIGGGTNTIHIYTAAEVAFDTQVGKTYQIQAVSSLSGGWQNVGGPVPGTGNAYSYVTPTRENLQQFYRVAVTP